MQETGCKPKAHVIGENGNVFNIMGICTRVLKREGKRQQAETLVKRVTSSGSYDEALNIMQEYVEFV